MDSIATKHIRLTITDIVKETTDAATFFVKADKPQQIHYRAGQFITLVFLMGNRAVRRSYSFTSTPEVDADLSFTVKRIHNGEISRLLLDTFKKGDHLVAIEPAGMFTYDNNNLKRDIFFFAAGSGITPVFSLIKHILHFSKAARVNLIYQNNTESSTIFRKQLNKLVLLYPEHFTWIDFVSQSENGNSRKLTNDQLELLIKELLSGSNEQALFYLCGPLSFMRMCQYTILLMGFHNHQLKKEYFVIDVTPPAPLIENPSTRKVLIKKERTHVAFTTLYPSTILQSALDQKIELPYSCKGGRCSACVARCVSGKVVMSMNDVLTANDIANGLVLTCVGYAVTDIELSYA